MNQVKEVPFRRLLPKWDSQGEKSTDDAPVCETKQRKLEYACSGLVLRKINDYLQINIYELLLTKSMMAKKRQWFISLHQQSIRDKSI